MSISQIEANVRQVLLQDNPETFIFELLLAYGKPKASITRLQAKGTGSYNLSKTPGSVLWKNHVFYQADLSKKTSLLLEQMKDSEAVEKHKPRFLIATDNKKISAWDMKTDEPLDVDIVQLASKFDFFLPWAGMEKSRQATDNPADVKAAEKMAKLYDYILSDNPATTKEEKHSLNVFLSRVLFCFFAEDTEIFSDGLFTQNVEAHTAKDGGDLTEYLQTLFEVLDTENRSQTPSYLEKFPYVNGGLFQVRYPVPKFNQRSRELLIKCGADLNWSEINPDIFGSMIQAVVDVEQRNNMGMHYTSYENIMKVVEPLFLTDLREEFEKGLDSPKKLDDLLKKLTQYRFFDPACGSGNFLIIAYKELRKLEMEVMNRHAELTKQTDFGLSGIQLKQFYGIELDDFAHEVAILSLWLAEHQMNLAFMKRFGRLAPTLPLKPSGSIVWGNALQTDWSEVCPNTNTGTTFILGNPPYLGSKKQDKQQKEDIATIFAGATNYKNLDYISCWFLKAARYIGATNAKAGLVTTNSIVQGDQVALLWPRIWQANAGIVFSVEQFKWGNNAKNSAGVTCVVIGLGTKATPTKRIYQQGHRIKVSNISPYLTDANDIIVSKRSSTISDLPEMGVGNTSYEGGFLKLNHDEREQIVGKYPSASKFIKRLTGGNEFLYDEENWAIWIEDDELAEALKIPPFRERIEEVKKMRIGGGDVARTLVNRSHQFRYRKVAKKDMLLVPCTSSERREYLTAGMMPAGSICLHSAQVVYDCDLTTFAVVSSRLHLLWTKAACGTLDSRVRYSNILGYNNFPMPKLSDAVKKKLTTHALTILSEREAHTEFCIADLYDPKNMPQSLKAAHERLDADFEAIYQSAPFASDQDRLNLLFKLYEKMVKVADAQSH